MKYKNISKKKLTLIGIGIVEPEGIINTKQAINNPNFIKVSEVVKKVEDKKIKKIKENE
jgi:hypothetical protein